MSQILYTQDMHAPANLSMGYEVYIPVYFFSKLNQTFLGNFDPKNIY